MGNQSGFPGGGRQAPTEEEKNRQRERRKEDGKLTLTQSYFILWVYQQLSL